MTARHWKLSQLISLAFVGALLVFVLVGTVATGESALLSDTVILQDAAGQQT